MKIKPVTYYICQFCGKKFTSESKCKEHEAKELGLTLEEYKTLEQLEKEEKETSWALANASNQELREAQDKAINAVIAFREEHHLEEAENLKHIH